jgi:hypothetical protein
MKQQECKQIEVYLNATYNFEQFGGQGGRTSKIWCKLIAG